MHRMIATVLVLTLTLSIPALAQTDAAPAPAPGATGTTKRDIAASKQLGWRLGTQAYTFRALSLFETIDTAKSLGLRYVEAYPGQRMSKEDPTKFNHDASPEQRAALKQKLKDTGVVLWQYGVVDLPRDEAAARKVFDFAREMEMKTIVSEPKEDAFDTIEKLVKEYDIKVAIHNHPRPSRYWNPDQVLAVIKDRDPRIGACADTGHWMRSGIKPVDAMKKLDGRIISFHFKDLGEFDRKEAQDIVWGTGSGDARGVLEEAKRQNFKGLIAIEYEAGSGQELVDNVRKCVEWFDQTAKELAE